MMRGKRLIAAAGLALGLAGCGAVEGALDDAKNRLENELNNQLDRLTEQLMAEISEAYPLDLAVASPFSYVDPQAAQIGGQFGSYLPMAEPSAPISRFEAATMRINAMLLETENKANCHFDPMMLTRPSGRAACYGPSISYKSHPDGTPVDGMLPHGDLGLWTATDPQSGEACAATQLNVGLETAGDVSTGALMGLAGMVCAAHVNGMSVTAETLNLVEEMNDLGMPNVTFEEAAINRDDSGFHYRLAFKFQKENGATEVAVEMAHAPKAVTTAYAGNVWFSVFEPGMQADCPGESGPGDGPATRNGSLRYDRVGAEELVLELRSGMYCGANVDGRNLEGALDPANRFLTGENESGWRKQFDILNADFNPRSLAGDYTYAWQAGTPDSHSRAFNVHVADEQAGVVGHAWFGFSKPIYETDGAVNGFICNWAGHGNQHVLKDLVQYQRMTRTNDEGFLPLESKLAYAPTNDCSYTGDTGFRFDHNADGTLEPTGDFLHDLLVTADGNDDGLLDHMVAQGFRLPRLPLP